MDSYTTIEGLAVAEFVEKRSRFIGEIRPVSTDEEAAAFLAEKRTAHYNASHHCHAYILRNGTQRYGDDGEPQGTAGVPILEVLRREQIQDAMVVVTRYFGGILLGTGGLARAYTHAAKIALDAAARAVICRCTGFSLTVSYPLYQQVSLLLTDCGARLLDSDFGQEVTLRALLPTVDYDGFAARLTQLSSGQVVPYGLEERFDRAALR